jgi:hypothetical protein
MARQVGRELQRIRRLPTGSSELGYVEGKNIIVEYRFGENSMEGLRDLAADLAGLKLNLILAVGTSAAKVAQQAGSSKSDHIHVR